MRRVFVVSLLLVVGLSTAALLASRDAADFARSQRAAAAVGTPLEWPMSMSVGQEQALDALESSASVAGVSVIRPVVGYDAQGRQSVAQHVYSPRTASTSRVLEEFRLASGRFPALDDVRGTEYASSDASDTSQQVGRLADFLGNDALKIASLGAAFDRAPVSGTYYLEGEARGVQLFRAELARRLGELTGTTVAVESLIPDGARGGGSAGSGLARLLWPVAIAMVFATCLFLMFWLLNDAKRLGVTKLHGLSLLRSWWVLCGRLIAFVMVSSSTVAAMASTFLPGADIGFTAYLGTYLLGVTVLTCVASMATLAYVEQGSIPATLKNRKHTTTAAATNIVFKLVATPLAMVVIAALFTQLVLGLAEREQLSLFGSHPEYGVFEASLMGNDLMDQTQANSVTDYETATSLYASLNQLGSLFVSVPRQEDPQNQSIVVNPNYLKRFPIVGVDGSNVAVAESVTDWVILVPAAQRGREAELTRMFEARRDDEARHQAYPQPEPRRAKVRIMWTRDHQRLFTFNMSVNPAEGHTIQSPIVQVMTVENSYPSDRMGTISGLSGSIKIRLVGGSVAATNAHLEPILKRLKLDDNFAPVMSIEAAISSQVSMIDKALMITVASMLVLVLFIMLLGVQLFQILASRYARRIAVRRLFGHSGLLTYRELVIINIVLSTLQVIAAIALNAVGFNPFATERGERAGTLALVVTIAFVVAAVEFAVLAVRTRALRPGRVRQVLKEEF